VFFLSKDMASLDKKLVELKTGTKQDFEVITVLRQSSKQILLLYLEAVLRTVLVQKRSRQSSIAIPTLYFFKSQWIG
jgi:hypothetical protein